ncbi:CPBP family intramembrane glutamic endopeptidase [Streptococcus porcinus]|uniref:CPBP family intramembrane metalloprotease n=2 Tax=Streptococcus porcinus TaxID=1340 RepID=A0A7V9WSQ9_STRPO|nr:type II CAAX endopeptidase family protein [Streptococcus porcinus]EGJ27055.1 CAAX amino terminal protease family protein [Streptococcus porcinus str. Jelinkova 176]MBA2796178.1 CPBP family intramembrane metalloprotease [Streptococcus porcinus]SQG42612.1 CAAX amino terminal protease [Streptococcus porcinus]
MKKYYSILAFYFCLMGFGLFYCKEFLNTSYDSSHFSKTFLPFMTLLALLVLFFGIKNKKHVILSTTNQPSYIFFILAFLPILGLSILSFAKNFSLTSHFLILLVDVTLIGIAEEGMFRGLLLGSLEKKFSPVKAIILSSIFFSLLHLLNILGGVTFSDVLNQMLSTFIMGLFLGCIYIDTKNIIFPIIFHSLWDYLILSNSIADFPFALILIFSISVLEIVISIILLLKFSKLRSAS